MAYLISGEIPCHAEEGTIPVRSANGPKMDKRTIQSTLKEQPIKVEIYERTIGPFKVDNKYFTILLKLKKILDTGVTFHETVEAFEIKDEEGNIHYQKAFDVIIDENGFRQSVSVEGMALEGKYGKGLILYYGIDPSAPSSGVSCQIFTLKGERLVPLSLPLTVYGKIYDLKRSSNNFLMLFDGDLMKFGVWTGNYRIVVPILVDWRRLTVRPFPHDLGDFQVEAEREPVEGETFVRLFRVRDLSTAPRHVVIRKTSKVEFLFASTKILLTTSDNHLIISAEDPWLRVRIDGNEGWVKEAGDLNALGLPDAG